ncbi:MAG: polyribonucleotide nucleotidyltransferase, partial [Candidatus Hydrogenedentota bacterium]
MIERLSVSVGSDDLIFETGRIAKQAHGAVLVSSGDAMVLSAACVAPEARPGQPFFPLTVEYREKSSSAGKIPGNFFRREGRPSEREILVCRLTDRPLRPLFPKGFLNETQIFSTVYSADNVSNPDVMSINGASAALHISKIPFDGPIAAVRVAMVDGELVINPSMESELELDLVMAGTRDGISMVEGQAAEATEDVMVEALELGHEAIKRICDCIDELRERVGVEKMEFEIHEPDAQAAEDVRAIVEDQVREAINIGEKQARADALSRIKTAVHEELAARYGEERYEELAGDITEVYEDVVKTFMRDQIVVERKRLDGRDLTTVRPITIEVGLLPRVHGSCLFTRGETQALVTATLGTSRDEQRLDELTGEEFRRFMLHYNFPPFSVGETRRYMGPGRREIGHGKLAERALNSVLPVDENIDPEFDQDFPYTIRVVSDITESNGSSSMASVCGGSLALMDAGVPAKAPVAGIAMGLIKKDEEVRILTDILGDEDHLGDMDFKVCGTREGITALQMDIKVQGLDREIMTQALQQARDARLHVLDEMDKCMAAPRSEISQYAPRIFTIKIDPDKIRDIIGPGGKVIREIQNQSGADIDIEDDGTVNVAASKREEADEAIRMIEAITASPEIGQIYTGSVSRIMNFGAFVSFMGGKEGLVHISELAPGHVREVTDVVNVGDEIKVKLVEIDKMGRLNLSKVEADRELGLISEEDE